MRKSGILLPRFQFAFGIWNRCVFKEHMSRGIFWRVQGQGFADSSVRAYGYGDSPYQSFSTFAGNSLCICPGGAGEKGLAFKEECEECDFGGDNGYVDYEKIYLSRFRILRKAYERSGIGKEEDFHRFQEENRFWLEDYGLYMAVKNSFGARSWTEWEEDIRVRKPEAVEAYKEKYKEEIEFYQFQQYLFAKQWLALKAYANKKGIQIIGDIPIYVALDSADTWAAPELFQLDEECRPIGVAGCPPDAFSATGQLWGNPLYRWEYHKETGYEWWMRRIAYCYRLYDVVRIDHFRGFDEYYFIPYGDDTAEFGHWEKGPGYDIFKTMKEKVGKKPVIAEDLGYLTPSVLKLVKKTGYPGMKVLQFAFDDSEDSDYLPHKYNGNAVVYTGTHDNDTTVGWYSTLNRRDKAFAKHYLNIRSTKEIHWDFIRAALSSVADTAVIPMQDYLGLGAEARINIPSTLGDNWKWRLKKGQLDEGLAKRIREMTKLYGRLGEV